MGPYTKVVSKLDPNGSSADITGSFCLTLVTFSPPKYTSNFEEKTFVTCTFNVPTVGEYSDNLNASGLLAVDEKRCFPRRCKPECVISRD